MNINQTDFNQIAVSLATHFESLYYVEIESGNFEEIKFSPMFESLDIPRRGNDFFSMIREAAKKHIHPADLENLLNLHNRETVLKNLSKRDTYIVSCRLLIDGKILHIQHVDIMCEDKKHILCCIENTEEEYQRKSQQERNLRSAERMARLDELTGIKNKNAFTEYSKAVDEKIKSVSKDFHFGLVMCDLNDLKLLNDTRGHSFGDEAIQRTSRMICDVFKHSPVFRIGGDEFVVVLTDCDYNDRNQLLEKIRGESESNRKSCSGPVVASGMAVYEPESDKSFCDVFERADREMYENKSLLKSRKAMEDFRKMDALDKVIPPERKRMLDRLFGALCTVADEGYIYLNDMRYDYSRWSLPLVDDFKLNSEYMYHADRIWKNYIHPDDLKVYEDAVDAVLCGNVELKKIFYRARKADGTYVLLTTRGFVLCDKDGKPEYFGGVMVVQ